MAAVQLPVLQTKGQGVLAEWRELESDPGLFSLLIEDYGVKGVRVEEVYDITHRFQTRVFGFVFLFRWVGDRRARKKSMAQGESFVMNTEVVNQMFFAHQIVNNSCASHALISVLLNCQDLSLGSTLSRLKDFSTGLDPESKGLAIANMVELARAHNKHARPSHDVAPPISRRASVVSSAHALLPETFHFVSYVPINDRLFELDGLKEFPIDHGPWGEQEEWTDLFQRIISQRLSGSGGQDIHFSLMAVVQDPLPEISQRLKTLQVKQKELLDGCIRLVREMRSGEGGGGVERGCEKGGEGEKEGEKRGGKGEKGDVGREEVKADEGREGAGGGEGGGEGDEKSTKEEEETKQEGVSREFKMEEDESAPEKGRTEREQVGERTGETEDEQKMECEEFERQQKEEENKKEEKKEVEKEEEEKKEKMADCKREEEGEELTSKVESGGESEGQRQEGEKEVKEEEETRDDCKMEEEGENKLTSKDSKVVSEGERGEQKQARKEEEEEEMKEDCKMEEGEVTSKDSKVEEGGEKAGERQGGEKAGEREGGEKAGELDGAGNTGDKNNEEKEGRNEREHSEMDGEEKDFVADKLDEGKEGGGKNDGELERDSETGEDRVKEETERGEGELVSENSKESEERSLHCNVKEERKENREREETREREEDKEREQPSSCREAAATKEEQHSPTNEREEGIKKEMKQEGAEEEEAGEAPMDLSEGVGPGRGAGPGSTASESGEPPSTKHEENDGTSSGVDSGGATESDADSISARLAEVAKSLPTERSELEEITNGEDTGSVEDRLKRAVAVFLLNDLDLECQKQKLKEEVELKQQYRVEFSRRTHDYDLLITNFLKFLAQNNQLPARLTRRPSGFANSKGLAGQKRPSGRAQLSRGEAQNSKQPKTTLLVNGTKVP